MGKRKIKPGLAAAVRAQTIAQSKPDAEVVRDVLAAGPYPMFPEFIREIVENDRRFQPRDSRLMPVVMFGFPKPKPPRSAVETLVLG